MRSPNEVLNSLQSKTTIVGYQFERLYRNLYNPNFYLIAYQNIYNNNGSMTRGIDGETLDGMGMERINRIIERLKNYSYQPNPVRRQYIKKTSGKLRPLGIPSADDKLVQEVVRMILESIYEPTFLKYSHGFRTDRSCHTALDQIQRTYTGVKWFVEGDITGCFDHIDQHILVDILRRKIRDEHFIGLIWKFLRAGYIENWQYNETYSGAAQGSVISPILANIYMHEMDVYMQEYKNHFDKGERRTPNPEYMRAKWRWKTAKKSMKQRWGTLTKQEQQQTMGDLEEKRKVWSCLPSMNPKDTNYRRIVYCRYADDFLVGIIGCKDDAEKVKSDIKEFLAKRLKLELSAEKTLVTHATDKVRFLGYDITATKPSMETIHQINGIQCRRPTGVIKLYVPKEKWINNLLDKEILWVKKDENGKEQWMPTARRNLINKEPADIVGIFNAEIRGIYNYYALASNVSVLSKYRYVMEYSMYKTFACKYRCSMGKAKQMFLKDGRFTVPYTTSKGIEKRLAFYDGGFCRKRLSRDNGVDILPQPLKSYTIKPRELIMRLYEGQCELCGEQDSQPKVYQVRKLSELRQDVEWEAKMIAKRRKTLVVCHNCYERIHS